MVHYNYKLRKCFVVKINIDKYFLQLCRSYSSNHVREKQLASEPEDYSTSLTLARACTAKGYCSRSVGRSVG